MIIREAKLVDKEKIAKVIVSGHKMDTIDEGIDVFLDEIKKDHFIFVTVK